MQGKAEAALAEMLKLDDQGSQLSGLALTYFALHRSKDAETTLARLVSEHGDDIPTEIAGAYAFRAEKDRALQWLDTAYVKRDHELIYIKSDFLLNNLRDDPRYKALVRKMNLPD